MYYSCIFLFLYTENTELVTTMSSVRKPVHKPATSYQHAASESNYVRYRKVIAPRNGWTGVNVPDDYKVDRNFRNNSQQLDESWTESEEPSLLSSSRFFILFYFFL